MRGRGLIEDLPAITSVGVLGLGFVALGLGYSWFWLVWVVGFVSLVPIAGILSNRVQESEPDAAPGTAPDESEALEILRERYAKGEIDEAEFERRLEDLLGTETVEEARARAERAPDRPSTDVERDRT